MSLFAPDYAPTLVSFGWRPQPSDHPGSLTLVDAPAGGPARVLRAELGPEDNNPVGNTSRAEAYALHAVPGSTPAEKWPLAPGGVYSFDLSYYLPSPFPVATDTTWLVLTQLKGYRGGSPPISVEAKRDRLIVKVTGKTWDLGGLPIDRWTAVRLATRLSVHGSDTDDSGWIQVERDGIEKVPRTLRRTMDLVNGRPDAIYLKQGLYRSKTWKAMLARHVALFGPPVVTSL